MTKAQESGEWLVSRLKEAMSVEGAIKKYAASD